MRPAAIDSTGLRSAVAERQALTGRQMEVRQLGDFAGPFAPAAKEAAGFDFAAGVQAAAVGGEVGELFSFTVAEPVDLARRRSAMIPIVHQAVQAEKVSIYNQRVLAKHPLNGVLLTNTTDLKLLAGPVTVFDGGMYAGDAQIDHLEKAGKRLLSYAVDLDVLVDPSDKTESRIASARIVKGVLQIIRTHTFTQTLKIRNKTASDRVIVVEHPVASPNRKLIEPARYEEKTASTYRFRTTVKAGDTAEFTIREEEPGPETIALLDQPVEHFAWYSTSGEIPAAVRDALVKVMELKRALTDAERALARLGEELNEIKNDQDRLRRNVSTAGRDTPQGRRYLDKLSEQEDRIEALEGKRGQLGLIDQARQNVDRARAVLEDHLANLDIRG